MKLTSSEKAIIINALRKSKHEFAPAFEKEIDKLIKKLGGNI